ncbi:TonB-dependent receptor plug domain-containing protein [Flavisphingomonas formosensis]|uniref:TonB-dependent receptor plug domain-containing protein n=1 Tax=Flavisphingomonas formosensis TaxID=861534 RepID=UPI0012F94CB8|nr:TonB-dependent receptor [Sphingomonas formosensis]
MNSLILLAAAAAAASPASDSPDTIVVTAALVPVSQVDVPASVTVFDQQQIRSRGAPFALDLIRLAPGVSVATSGDMGALTQIRIRGAEANHTLVYIDGIDFNDLASDDQPRFETFAADGLGRIEVIRGPQSAIYGSEALGGVIALDTPDPFGALRATASAEYGSHDFARTSAAIASGGDKVGISATGSFARSDGIDILGGGTGDKDGFKSYSASLKAVARPGSDGEIGIVGHYIHHHDEFDGTPPPYYLRGDTAESSTAETYALRSWARLGLGPDAAWSGQIDAQYLDSTNRNYDGDVHTNDSIGRRTRIGGQIVHRFAFGSNRQTLIARIDREDEHYATRDRQYGSASDVDYSRGRTALLGEWLGEWGSLLSTDVALRHDAFNRFKDATTVRAHAILHVTPAIGIVGGYSEGISQPGFAELFGYGRDTGFLGNPALTPEKSRGFEAGLRWAGHTASLELTGFSNALRDEIVYTGLPATPTIPYPYTYVNDPGKSRRRGFELSGEWRPIAGLRLNANYTYLDARDGSKVREVRRPKHSANLYADWIKGPFSLGGSLSYVGKRRDIDFDIYQPVELKDYVLAGGRIAYAISSNLEIFGRIENAFDSHYQDVVGYRTLGRTVYGGLRVRLGE